MAYKIRSEFIKNKIRGQPFKKRDSKYINDLIFIERWIVGDTGGMGASYKWNGTCRDEYPVEIKAIALELEPKFYTDYQKEQKQMKKEDEELERWADREEKKELKAEKKAWLKAGGVA